MARLTVEDCLRHIKNRFDLVIKASKRARMLERGGMPKVDWDNDKPTVVALREIAEGLTADEAPKEENPFEAIESEENKTEEIKETMAVDGGPEENAEAQASQLEFPETSSEPKTEDTLENTDQTASEQTPEGASEEKQKEE